jgi:hypothetical protein
MAALRPLATAGALPPVWLSVRVAAPENAPRPHFRRATSECWFLESAMSAAVDEFASQPVLAEQGLVGERQRPRPAKPDPAHVAEDAWERRNSCRTP